MTPRKESLLFKKYMDRIANDFKMPCRTPSERQAVFDQVMSMTSWNNKACCPKTSRWFSWVEASHEQLAEFWASKMILEAYLKHHGLDDDDDHDDAAENANPSDSEFNLKKLRDAGNGGLQLVYKCLTDRVWQDASIISRVGQVLWTCYTEHIQHVKSASDQVDYSVAMVKHWMNCSELQGLAGLLSDGSLAGLFDRCIDETEAAQKALSYVVHLMGNRASSLSKHGAPPHCYANVLQSRDALSARVLKQMRWDWKSLVSLELSGIDDGGLAEDLRICIDAPTRIMLQCFEMADWCQSDDHQVDLEPALDILMCIIQKPPDSKAVEDLHQRLRMKTKDRANEKITPTCCQHVVNTSNILDSRHVGHPAAINRYSFFNFFKKTKSSEFGRKLMLSKRHKLPKMFGRIMSSKGRWTSVTEESLPRSYAAWACFRYYTSRSLQSQGIQVKETLLDIQQTLVVCTFLLAKNVFGISFCLSCLHTIVHIFLCLKLETHVALCCSKGCSVDKLVPKNDDFGEGGR